jgi:glycosyltransferase involved in cell wall biosynthesis
LSELVEDSPKISIIISTYNRVDKLVAVLQRLCDQRNIENFRFEVIVVDNNSTDNTMQAVQDYSEKSKVFYYNEPQQGLGYVRNAGFSLSNGKYIAYLDDDALPNPNWVQAIAELIDEYHPDCICGPIFPYYTSESPAWFKDEYEIRSHGDRIKWLDVGKEGSGSNMIWKREVLEDLGRVNVKLGMSGEYIGGGEDTDLFFRYWQLPKRKGILYSPNLEVKHWVPPYKFNPKYWLKRQYAAGVAASEIRKDEKLVKRIFKTIRLIVEIGLIALLVIPITRFGYRYYQNWVIEWIRPLAFRLGWLANNLGMRISFTHE